MISSHSQLLHLGGHHAFSDHTTEAIDVASLRRPGNPSPRFSGLEIPAAINHPFGTLLLAYLVLLAGNLVEGA
jgi:hypothetical protein